jgi:uncharacterized protein
MNSVIEIIAVLTMLLVVGGALGLADRRAFSARWLLVAAALVLFNDFLLTRGYHTLPNLLPAAEWNWQGKVLALAATLAIGATPAFGWRRCGLTVVQAPGSLKIATLVALVYGLVFVGVAFLFPRGESSPETVAFQATMPGLEEEAFYRGLLLFALDRAFRRRVRWLGVEWGWGAVISCALFGLAHALGFSNGGFTFDALTMAMTGGTAFLAVWIRYRTGSVLIPVLMHNFGNSIFEFI